MNPASTYRGQSLLYADEELELEARKLHETVFGADHPSTLACVNNLAFTYRMQARWTEAEEVDLGVIDASIRLLGDKHPFTMASKADLAATYRDQGKLSEARTLEAGVLEEKEGRFRGESPTHSDEQVANLVVTYQKLSQ